MTQNPQAPVHRQPWLHELSICVDGNATALSSTSGDMRPGTQMEVTFGMGPIKAKVGLEITAVEAGRRMAWKTFSGPVDWQGEYVLVPTDGGGARLSQSGTMKFKGLWRAVEAMVGAEMKAGEIKELEMLKSMVEAT